MKMLLILLVVLALAAGGIWFGIARAKGADPAGKAGAPPAGVPVTAATVARRDVPIYLDGLGTVQGFFTVTVHSQVDGQLSRVAFTEGQDVKKGDLLAEIDPRIFQAQVDQAAAKVKQDRAREQQDQAKVKQDEAKKVQDEALVRQVRARKVQDDVNLANAKVNLKRFEETLPSGGSTEQNVADQKALVAQTEAALQADEATIQAGEAGVLADAAAMLADQAVLEADRAATQADEAAVRYAETFLSYTKITAPVSGRVGVRQVDPGNIVHASDPNGIVTLTQLEPITVLFTLPQQDLPALSARMVQEKLPVTARDPNDKSEVDHGVLELVDNQIDTSIGSIRLKATFPNAQRRLWPGGFVNVRLLLETRSGVAVIPAPAVQKGPEGDFVYVIKDDLTVEMRPVEADRYQDGQALLKSGPEPGQRVVLTGQDRLKPGSKVALPQAKGAGGAPAAGRAGPGGAGAPAENRPSRAGRGAGGGR